MSLMATLTGGLHMSRSHQGIETKEIRAADAKEVGVGNPAEERAATRMPQCYIRVTVCQQTAARRGRYLSVVPKPGTK